MIFIGLLGHVVNLSDLRQSLWTGADSPYVGSAEAHGVSTMMAEPAGTVVGNFAVAKRVSGSLTPVTRPLLILRSLLID